MSWADDTFGGRNPKVGVNHVHWSFALCAMDVYICMYHCLCLNVS